VDNSVEILGFSKSIYTGKPCGHSGILKPFIPRTLAKRLDSWRVFIPEISMEIFDFSNKFSLETFTFATKLAVCT